MPSISSSDVSLIIGPEGGFEAEEAEMLVSKGFTPCTPLSAVLKAETASVLFTGMIRSIMDCG